MIIKYFGDHTWQETLVWLKNQQFYEKNEDISAKIKQHIIQNFPHVWEKYHTFCYRYTKISLC